MTDIPGGGRNRFNPFVQHVVAAFVVIAALYFARVIFEPIAFTLFSLALVWPFQKALEARLPGPAALGLTILLALLVILVFGAAIVWSVDDIVHWTIVNITRFQSLYVRWSSWLEGYGIFITEGVGPYDGRSLIQDLRTIAAEANRFMGFCIVVFLLLTFSLTEMDVFRRRLESLAPSIGRDVCRTTAEIAAKIRKYMLIRTLASVITGLAVFVFTFSSGMDLSVAWGIISFVLNYIPYIGPLIAVALPVLFASVQFESLNMVIFIFLGLYLIQFVIGNYIEPVIAGKALAISPLVMLVAFFFWAFLWEIPGAFIGIPMTIALLTVCERTRSLSWLAKLLSARE